MLRCKTYSCFASGQSHGFSFPFSKKKEKKKQQENMQDTKDRGRQKQMTRDRL